MWKSLKGIAKKVNYRDGAWFFFGFAMASFRIDAADGYTYLFFSAICGLISLKDRKQRKIKDCKNTIVG